MPKSPFIHKTTSAYKGGRGLGPSTPGGGGPRFELLLLAVITIELSYLIYLQLKLNRRLEAKGTDLPVQNVEYTSNPV